MADRVSALALDALEIYPRWAAPSAAAAAIAMASWRERETERQAHRRDDNESTALARASVTGTDRLSAFRCECGDQGCTCAIRLTLAEYESVRAYATHFAIAPDHENPESEQLIQEHERFAVVETVSGDAAKAARRSYPRRLRRQGTSVDRRLRRAPGGAT